VHLDLEVEWNGAAFGHPNGREMNFGFGELVAHAARNGKGDTPFGVVEQQVVPRR